MDKLIVCGLALGIITLNSCKPKEKIVIEEVEVQVSTEQNIPSTYAFTSRFSEGVSSVSHTGQTARQLLIQDIKLLIEKNTASGNKVKTDVLALFNTTGTPTGNSLTTAGSFGINEVTYSNIASGKNLIDKTSDASVISYNKSAETLIGEWLDAIDTRIDAGKTGSDAYTSDDYLDYNQLINKTLSGAVIYSQGANNYLGKVLTEDNIEPKSTGSTYTTMEHVWDEAFGYFGAARDYSSYTDIELKNGDLKDSDKDGKINFHGEYNFGISRNAAKRDVGATDAIDFSKEAFDLFLAGRTAISNKRSATEIEPYAKNACIVWEKVIAATLVHYINDVKSDLDVSGFGSLAKHFSEAKGFLISLQYGNTKYQQISTGDLNTLHTLLGQNPVTNTVSTLPKTNKAVSSKTIAQYKTDLDEANTILRRVYNFSDNNVQNWRPSK